MNSKTYTELVHILDPESKADLKDETLDEMFKEFAQMDIEMWIDPTSHVIQKHILRTSRVQPAKYPMLSTRSI